MARKYTKKKVFKYALDKILETIGEAKPKTVPGLPKDTGKASRSKSKKVRQQKDAAKKEANISTEKIKKAGREDFLAKNNDPVNPMKNATVEEIMAVRDRRLGKISTSDLSPEMQDKLAKRGVLKSSSVKKRVKKKVKKKPKIKKLNSEE